MEVEDDGGVVGDGGDDAALLFGAVVGPGDFACVRGRMQWRHGCGLSTGNHAAHGC